MEPASKVGRSILQPQLRIEGVTKEFSTRKNGPPIRALDGIDLEVQVGEFLSLLGPSGCGKSTLLNIVAGFQRPTAGHVIQEGVEIFRPDRRRTVVFQDYALFPWMTVQKNVEFGLKAKGTPPEERRSIARRYLELVDLIGFEDRFPYEISGGMKQRAAIARALAPNPDILLMDEPFGALDAQTRLLMQEEVARIGMETKKTILFVTHSIEEAVFLSDRVAVMSARPGRIRLVAPVPLERPRTQASRQAPAFVNLVEDLWASLKPEWQDKKENDVSGIK